MPSSDSTMMKKGTKRKIEIKKRETKEQRAVTCSKRRQTVFSKAADLCLISGANIAVFVTSPSDSSDVVYSFSGYSSAYEIADCYLNRQPPPKIVNPAGSKLGFWWEDPDLYHSCDDLSELSIIEDRLQRMKKHVMACLEKEEKSQLVSSFDQNPNSTCSLDVEDCDGSSYSQIASTFTPNSVNEYCSDQTFASFHGDQNPNLSSPSFDQDCYSSLYQICGESSSQVASFDPNPSSEIQGFETEEENNQINLLLQETQTEANVNLDDEICFWNDLSNDDVFGLNSYFCLDTTNARFRL
ncbi:unnamed protein product [Arabidopsis thaliana]|uniref:(thale cress) hypothetical protein n=1 Tax=Arabidopsis thaliana TaxID=3702 RepID=A0A7G2FAM4_ARATH|nr:unnamed protein product [Arabidopsis thaliana]